MSEAVIEATGLTKRYGEAVAVNDISFTINRGEIFGLLGPNGAGKTTTILMLLGLTEVTAGTVRILGHDPVREPLDVKRVVGYLPDAVGFYDHMTAADNLRYTAGLIGIPVAERGKRIASALDRVGLADVADRRVGAFSRGMRQRLGLSEILMKDVSIAILDEPTSGLDPLGRLLVRDVIDELRAAGTAVFLNSHLLGEVEVTCDRVAFVKRGVVVREMSLADRDGALEVEVHVDRVTPELLEGLAAFGQDVAPSNGGARLAVDSEERLPEIARWIVERGFALYRLAADRKTLGVEFALVVVDVVGQPAQSSPILPGDIILAVNQQRFSSIEEFNKLLAQQEKGASVALLVRRGEGAIYVPIPVG